jgi:transcriptional regulator with XRE-family HTH domain
MAKKKATPRTAERKPAAVSSGASPESPARRPTIGPAAKALGARLRDLRVQRDMSQGDIEERTGLLRCYVSRVENGWTIPSVETLEKFAAALAVPLHLLFYTGKGSPKPLASLSREVREEREVPDPFAKKLRRLVGKMGDRERQTLFNLVRKLTVMGA